MKGAVIIFSVIWDSRLRKYKEKSTASLSFAEIMNIYRSYKTEKEAQTVSQGLNRKQGSELSREATSLEKRKQA